MGGDLIARQQVTDRLISQRDDFVDLMGGAKTVKEMNKGHPAFQGRNVGDQGKILRLLDAASAEHGAAGLAHGHDVGVIAKD